MRRARGRPADVVLLAGKGHEDYQEVAGVQAPLLRRGEARPRWPRGQGDAAVNPTHDDAGPGPRAAARQPCWSATARRRHPRAQRHPQPAPGDLFVALRGERFDAQRLPGRRRAPPAPWRRWPSAAWAPDCRPAGADTLAALQQLAAAWRARFTLPLIAVTGSNGKTTVTQMIAAILRAWLGEPPGHAGQPEQPHRRAADAAAPAPAPPRRGGRTGHEPPGRDRAAGAPGRAHRGPGQQRAARAPGVHGHAWSRGARERRVISALGRRHGGVPGRRRLRAAVARAGRPRAC
jgi:hypothetical protein